MPDRRSFHTRRCGVFAEPKNKREALIKAENDAEYARFHESPGQDAGLIAEARPNPACPACGESDQAIRWGKAKSGIPRYCCKRCGRTSAPASGGLIDQRKLPMRTMVKFLVNILTGTSVSEASKAAKISMTTAPLLDGQDFRCPYLVAKLNHPLGRRLHRREAPRRRPFRN